MRSRFGANPGGGCPAATESNSSAMAFRSAGSTVQPEPVLRMISSANEPADQPYGDRRYEVHDPEGQAWFFAQRL